MQTIMALPRERDRDSVREGGDEPALVKAARQQAAAFAPLYHRYRDRVYWYARTRTTTEEDADDLTQHIFARALDALPQYRPHRGSFAVWLFAIARHTLIDFYRQQRPTVAWDLVPDALLPPAPHDVEAEMLRREDLDRLRVLVQALAADKREVVVLRFVAGLTVGEIAAVIGKGEAATRKQLARTLRALAADFGGA